MRIAAKIKDIITDNIISIANRNIEQVQIVSNSLYVNFPMPYEVPVDKAEKVIDNIVIKIKEFEDVEDVEYKGVTELADSSIKYLLKIISISNELKKRILRKYIKIWKMNTSMSRIEKLYFPSYLEFGRL